MKANTVLPLFTEPTQVPQRPLEKLPLQFYQRRDVVAVAKDLLGKVLVTAFGGERTTGRIVETEAYAGETDRASHAARGYTPRTAVMYGHGGQAYVYLCYGLHRLFNVVTSVDGEPHAVLVRAVEPLEDVETMLRRTGRTKVDASLTAGPGRVGKAFGFDTAQCGLSLLGDELFIADDGYAVAESDIVAGSRIGVDYAGDHAAWPYRFYLRGNPFVSGRRNQRATGTD